MQPIAEIVKAVRAREKSLGLTAGRVLVHTDACQTLGKVEVNVAALGADMVTLAGHKLYAPKGVGALWVRSGLVLSPSSSSSSAPRVLAQLHGGGQERGLRPGTENVILAASFGAACAHELVSDPAAARAEQQRYAALVARLESKLREGYHGELRINGPALDEEAAKKAVAAGKCPSWSRLPNTLSIGFGGVLAPALLEAIREHVACSGKSACHVDAPSASAGGGDAGARAAATEREISPTVRSILSGVLKAMGSPLDFALGTLRLSVGRSTTEVDVDRAARIIVAAANDLYAQRGQGVGSGPLKAPKSAFDAAEIAAAAAVAAPAAAATAATAADAAAASATSASCGGGGAFAAASAAASAAACATIKVPPTECLYLADTKLVEGTARVLGAEFPSAEEGKSQAGDQDFILFLDRTVFHPQGGGQPSDTGTIVMVAPGGRSLSFRVTMARKDFATGVVKHMGALFEGDRGEPMSREAARVVLCGGASAVATAVQAGDDVAVAVDPKVGAGAKLSADAAARALHARLHSGGHLLDQYVASNSRQLRWTGRGRRLTDHLHLRPPRAMIAAGMTLRPTKGMHFPGSPWVEYEGKVRKITRWWN